MHRLDKRKNDQMREVSIIPEFNKHAEGSALIKFGDTQVICNASIEKACLLYTSPSPRDCQ